MNLMALIFVVALGFGMLFTSQLITLIAPGFEGERFLVAVGLTG
jgi:hypothetical protein